MRHVASQPYIWYGTCLIMKIDQSLLDQVKHIAIMAGRAINAIYLSNDPLDIKTKQDNSPVTIADLAAHNIIVEGLTELNPHIPILSEEDANFHYDVRKQWQVYWLVDPLDGTQEFINRSGQFTVNIALIQDSRPILGVIYVPLKNVLYYSAKNLGAYLEDDANNRHELKIKQRESQDRIILVATRKELHENLQEQLSTYGQVKVTYRSSSLKFCLLAEGNADIYLRKKPIHEWDIAAGHCILEQAGGTVLDSNWQPLRYNTRPHLRNPPFIALGDSKQLLPILKTMPMF